MRCPTRAARSRRWRIRKRRDERRRRMPRWPCARALPRLLRALWRWELVHLRARARPWEWQRAGARLSPAIAISLLRLCLCERRAKRFAVNARGGAPTRSSSRATTVHAGTSTTVHARWSRRHHHAGVHHGHHGHLHWHLHTHSHAHTRVHCRHHGHVLHPCTPATDVRAPLPLVARSCNSLLSHRDLICLLGCQHGLLVCCHERRVHLLSARVHHEIWRH